MPRGLGEDPRHCLLLPFSRIELNWLLEPGLYLCLGYVDGHLLIGVGVAGQPVCDYVETDNRATLTPSAISWPTGIDGVSPPSSPLVGASSPLPPGRRRWPGEPSCP